ncbi:hypothetical protein [Deinococcus ficus]|uniref:Uncharacterized protein n=1 Tax=Deinococcus ficus TaxID=317577 RepID=A0A221T335_9DEIO|nr:hypothetical protein [Deinococcus ficus]ASN83318.1 hypothetical protein DFI_19160 [Deinococcus ficus]
MPHAARPFTPHRRPEYAAATVAATFRHATGRPCDLANVLLEELAHEDVPASRVTASHLARLTGTPVIYDAVQLSAAECAVSLATPSGRHEVARVVLGHSPDAQRARDLNARLTQLHLSEQRHAGESPLEREARLELEAECEMEACAVEEDGG